MDGAALLSRLRERSDFMGGAVIPPDFWPETEEDCKLILSEAIVLLKTNNKSGYQHVYPVKSGSKPWQAKPYIRPKVQRSLGSFYTAEEAAVAVVHWSLGMLPTPPSPLVATAAVKAPAHAIGARSGLLRRMRTSVRCVPSSWMRMA